MKKAVIFDLDGTLSDSISSMKYCGDLAVAPYGYGPFSEDQYKYFVGDGAANLVKRALAAGGDVDFTHFPEAFARYRELFREYCMYGVHPYPGIVELLKELRKAGVACCVLSNKPHAESVRVVEELFGKECFTFIRGQMDGVAIKPSPEGVFRILEDLNRISGERITSRDCLYLGDTATDMHTGKAAGIFTIGVLWGFRTREELEQAGADALVEQPAQVLEYL